MSLSPALHLPSKPKYWVAGVVAVISLLPLLFRGIMSSDFLPHAFCFSWDKRLMTLHVVCDVLIWLSYVAIATTLVQLVRKTRHDISFQWMFIAFGAFIITCGFTHFMEVVTLWQPVYWLAGYVKAITAVASILTAITLPSFVPKILEMDRAAARTKQAQLELSATNRELEAFSYSVSHDLRAPLRVIDGFSQAVLEDHGEKLGEAGAADLQRVRAAAKRMDGLIDDLLVLARTARSEMVHERVDLSGLSEQIMGQLRSSSPGRLVELQIAPDMVVNGDRGLLRVAMENLLGNAWKFSSQRELAQIEVGHEQKDGRDVYFIRDNGAGFEMKYADKLFAPFQRMHDVNAFPGTGMGLATVQRIVRRHGGEIWAQASPNNGATFYFTL